MSSKTQTISMPTDATNHPKTRRGPGDDLPTMPDPSTNNPDGGQHLPTMPDPVKDPSSGPQLPAEPDPPSRPVQIDDPPIVDEDEERVTSPSV
jgi:hypothetical protein